QRIGQPLDDRLVDLAILAFRDEADRLARHVGDLTYDAGHALEDRPHRLRADRHDGILDLAGEMLEVVKAHGDVRKAGYAGLGYALRQHRLVDDQFADQIDQTVDAVEIDA